MLAWNQEPHRNFVIRVYAFSLKGLWRSYIRSSWLKFLIFQTYFGFCTPVFWKLGLSLSSGVRKVRMVVLWWARFRKRVHVTGQVGSWTMYITQNSAVTYSNCLLSLRDLLPSPEVLQERRCGAESRIVAVRVTRNSPRPPTSMSVRTRLVSRT